MKETQRRAFKLLLFADAAAIIVSMVAGPLDRTAVAIGAASGAILISLCLLGYALWLWPKNR